MWDRNHLSNMIEIDFFGASNHRSTSERERLIEEFEGASRDNSDFMNYGYDYYDNADYGVGYGGYHFDGRYAGSVANIISHYGLTPGSTVLELGCAKGFTLTEFLKRDMKICGVDISAYATDNALPEVRPYIIQGSSVGLCFGSRCIRSGVLQGNASAPDRGSGAAGNCRGYTGLPDRQYLLRGSSRQRRKSPGSYEDMGRNAPVPQERQLVARNVP